MAGAFRILAGAAEVRLREGREARREASVGGDRVMQDIAAIKDYHVHVYYDPSTKPKAAQLRQWVEERFAGQMRMGSWHDEEVGPHVQAMYQIAFPPELFPSLVPFIMMNRMGLTVLVHPQSGRPRDDHTVNAMWMGEVLPVKTHVLREVG
jgi:DOPA 4,5-dioxygenase